VCDDFAAVRESIAMVKIAHRDDFEQPDSWSGKAVRNGTLMGRGRSIRNATLMCPAMYRDTRENMALYLGERAQHLWE
jgi:hypothetical protein